jgi:hypothetical protein
MFPANLGFWPIPALWCSLESSRGTYPLEIWKENFIKATWVLNSQGKLP